MAERKPLPWGRFATYQMSSRDTLVAANHKALCAYAMDTGSITVRLDATEAAMAVALRVREVTKCKINVGLTPFGAWTPWRSNDLVDPAPPDENTARLHKYLGWVVNKAFKLRAVGVSPDVCVWEHIHGKKDMLQKTGWLPGVSKQKDALILERYQQVQAILEGVWPVLDIIPYGHPFSAIYPPGFKAVLCHHQYDQTPQETEKGSGFKRLVKMEGRKAFFVKLVPATAAAWGKHLAQSAAWNPIRQFVFWPPALSSPEWNIAFGSFVTAWHTGAK